MNAEDRALLLDTLKKDGESPPKVPETAIHQLEETCARTGLDWRLRHVYLIQRGGKWRVELSIDGFRAIANAQEDYDGQETFWAMGPDGPWTDVPPDKQPYAAKVCVYRKGQAKPTTGQCKYTDYATGPMWKKFPTTMVAKCAEMLALRKAFPGKLGGLYGAEEMDQAGGSKTERKGRASKDSPDSAQSSQSEQSEPEVDWLGLITRAESLTDLRVVGARIQESHLKLQEKLELQKHYNARKAELTATEVKSG